MTVFPGQTPRFTAHGGDQFPGILRGDPQSCMNHGSAAGLGHHPFAAQGFGEIDGLYGTETNTHPASLAGNRIDGVRLAFTACSNCVEPAYFKAFPAADTIRRTDYRLVTAAEFMPFPDTRREDEMQIRGVHIAIGEHRKPGKNGKGGRNTRLAGPSLAAD
jgi:hypothetical protein